MQLLLYFRLLFLPILAICAHHSCTPPNAVPPPGERDKYGTRKTFQFGESGFTIIHASAVVKYVTWAINILELVTILSLISSTPIALPPGLAKANIYLNAHSAVFVAEALLSVSSTILRVSSYRHLGRFFTYQLSIRSGHKLVTDGPYRIVRHPGYTALCAFLLGDVLCQLGPGSVWAQLGLWRNPVCCGIGLMQTCLAAYVGFVVSVLRVPKEDGILREQFKDEWEVWAKKTPCKLIPFVY